MSSHINLLSLELRELSLRQYLLIKCTHRMGEREVNGALKISFKRVKEQLLYCFSLPHFYQAVEKLKKREKFHSWFETWWNFPLQLCFSSGKFWCLKFYLFCRVTEWTLLHSHGAHILKVLRIYGNREFIEDFSRGV